MAVLSVPSARATILGTISKWLNVKALGSPWRIIALILAIVNFKNLPWVWHSRFFYSLFRQLYAQSADAPPGSLFAPIISTTRTPLTECDYNIHKSNSTYFTDLDIARTHLAIALMRKSIRGLSTYHREIREHNRQRRDQGLPEKAVDDVPGDTKLNGAAINGADTPSMHTTPPETPKEIPAGNFNMAMGGVACLFHREIPPLARVEIWTRLVSWDRKWLYIVSHFVKAGAWSEEIADQGGWIFQPWRNRRVPKSGGAARKRREEMSPAERDAHRAKLKKTIYASSIAKYVVKKGRLTVPPELVLQRSDLLPPKPPTAPPANQLPTLANRQLLTPGALATETTTPAELDGAPTSAPTDADMLEESLFPFSQEAGEWTWEKIEERRLRGMRIAQHFAGLDRLYDVFGGEDDQALGMYSDL
ncbi:hypothetical protein P152DRAFT_472204 [Eremomyces bilateralis CBS 781.70]|uniref:Capsule polysaccharide biosynthesis protein n=1 Tax=Eremomyces bilateralis CBS 781.70 TaxID=1392243 RepID=A0A6G1G8N7_9PEZI|nr:uncharacterized protein P152DRAFT_472204 [Eremomyces bilateralis CBS 781.70]KAF1814437.1 hypothetical protein P152DRAFT_472204 [Eremomyces bilateralis CBS 781.70]